MAYIDTEDIEDEILVDLVQDSDIEFATSKLNTIARSLGVLPENISVPLVDDVRELVISLVCERRAKLSVGTAARNDGGNDIYEMKRSTYARDVQRLTYSMTSAQLLGTASNSTDMSCTIELFRA